MKELDLSIINAVDLDVPQDPLVFGVVQRPSYGFLINGVHGSDVLHYKELINHDHHSHGLLVHEFSMELLRNGRCSILLTMVFHYLNETMKWHTKRNLHHLFIHLPYVFFSRQCLAMEVVLFNPILIF